MSSANRWLMIDGNSLVTYLWFRNPNQNVASNVWLYIADFMQSYNLSNVAIAWDWVYSKGKQTGMSCRRRQEFGEYKGSRVPHPQWSLEKPKVMKEVKSSLKQIPVRQGTIEGLEADDIVWCWSQMVDGLIISGDEDLWQCCNENVRVYSPRKKVEVGLEIIDEKFGSVHAMMIQKSLVGDTSDCINGVSGIGWSRAKKLWQDYSHILSSLAIGNETECGSKDDKWLNEVIRQVEVFKRNWKIMKLGEMINENDMMKAETFLLQPVKFEVNDARHYVAFKGWHEIIRKWNPISQVFQKAIPS